MPKSNEHELDSLLGFMNSVELLHQLSRFRLPSMDNSTHHYNAVFFRRLRAFNVTLWNNSWQDVLPNNDTAAAADVVPDECFPFLGVLDFFHLYYIPTIIFTGMSHLTFLFL
jgi:hypothetical protein